MKKLQLLPVLATALTLTVPAIANADEQLFDKAYAGIQMVDGEIGFRLGGDYTINESFYASADYTRYSYNEDVFGEDYDYSYSLLYVAAGMMFPLDAGELPFRSLTAYAEGGVGIMSVSYDVGSFSDSVSDTALYIGGGARGYINEEFWADLGASLVTASDSDFSLKLEGGYTISEQFDVSVQLDTGSLGEMAIGVLGNYKF